MQMQMKFYFNMRDNVYNPRKSVSHLLINCIIPLFMAMNLAKAQGISEYLDHRFLLVTSHVFKQFCVD